MTIERFEDLIAWQKARILSKAIYNSSSKGLFSRDYGLRDQIRRAIVSVMSNIVEGFDRGGRGEFHQFLVIAKGSCAEVRSQLYVAYDAGYLNNEEFKQLNASALELSRIIGACVLQSRDNAMHNLQFSVFNTQSSDLSPHFSIL